MTVKMKYNSVFKSFTVNIRTKMENSVQWNEGYAWRLPLWLELVLSEMASYIYLWWITTPCFDKVEHSNESFSRSFSLSIQSIVLFRVSVCEFLSRWTWWISRSFGLIVTSGGDMVEAWWWLRVYSGETRSVPFYIWIWTTYTLWLPGSLIGYNNAGFIQDYLVYLKPMGNLC